MQLLQIEEIKNIKTSDNQTLSIVKGKPKNTFNIAFQPSSVMVVTENNISNKVGDIIDIESNHYLSFINQSSPKDPWELYGSDHNSGILWYGKNEDLKTVTQNIEKELESYVNQSTKKDIVEPINDETFNSSCFVRWNFDDDTSLIIFYSPPESNDFNQDTSKISAPNVVSYEFGADIDDILCHEIIQYFPGTLLKKIKIADMEVDDEIMEETESYSENVLINNKPKSKKDNELILDLSYHLFCTMMNWQEDDNIEVEEEDIHTSCLAKKLAKYKFIKNLQAPTTDHSERLIFISEDSNKEYNLSLTYNDGQWNVTATYGGIGNSMKSKTKISTPYLDKAQQAYIATLDEKLSEGYEIEQHISNTKKNKI